MRSVRCISALSVTENCLIISWTLYRGRYIFKKIKTWFPPKRFLPKRFLEHGYQISRFRLKTPVFETNLQFSSIREKSPVFHSREIFIIIIIAYLNYVENNKKVCDYIRNSYYLMNNKKVCNCVRTVYNLAIIIKRCLWLCLHFRLVKY